MAARVPEPHDECDGANDTGLPPVRSITYQMTSAHQWTYVLRFNGPLDETQLQAVVRTVYQLGGNGTSFQYTLGDDYALIQPSASIGGDHELLTRLHELYRPEVARTGTIRLTPPSGGIYNRAELWLHGVDIDDFPDIQAIVDSMKSVEEVHEVRFDRTSSLFHFSYFALGDHQDMKRRLQELLDADLAAYTESHIRFYMFGDRDSGPFG